MVWEATCKKQGKTLWNQGKMPKIASAENKRKSWNFDTRKFSKKKRKSAEQRNFHTPVWCSFSALNKNFPQCPGLICVKWFLLILPRSLFRPMPIVLRNCFWIFVLSEFYVFIFISSTSLLIWNFLICHLGVRIPVPDKCVFLRSSLIRFDKIQIWVIISLNLHYCVSALYNFHILTLIL